MSFLPLNAIHTFGDGMWQNMIRIDDHRFYVWDDTGVRVAIVDGTDITFSEYVTGQVPPGARGTQQRYIGYLNNEAMIPFRDGSVLWPWEPQVMSVVDGKPQAWAAQSDIEARSTFQIGRYSFARGCNLDDRHFLITDGVEYVIAKVQCNADGTTTYYGNSTNGVGGIELGFVQDRVYLGGGAAYSWDNVTGAPSGPWSPTGIESVGSSDSFKIREDQDGWTVLTYYNVSFTYDPAAGTYLNVFAFGYAHQARIAVVSKPTGRITAHDAWTWEVYVTEQFEDSVNNHYGSDYVYTPELNDVYVYNAVRRDTYVGSDTWGLHGLNFMTQEEKDALPEGSEVFYTHVAAITTANGNLAYEGGINNNYVFAQLFDVTGDVPVLVDQRLVASAPDSYASDTYAYDMEYWLNDSQMANNTLAIFLPRNTPDTMALQMITLPCTPTGFGAMTGPVDLWSNTYHLRVPDSEVVSVKLSEDLIIVARNTNNPYAGAGDMKVGVFGSFNGVADNKDTPNPVNEEQSITAAQQQVVARFTRGRDV